MAIEPQDISDEDLLESIKEGDSNAFAELVKRHSSKFYSLSYRYLANKPDAEDLVQVAFLKLWENPHKWNPNKGAKFTTWFYRIVVNLCLDKKRKFKELPLKFEENIVSEDKNIDEILIEEQKEAMLERAIIQLPERQQTALNLCFYEGLTNQEAADVMELSLRALQSLLMRAKNNLKKALK